jgi:hypothetical protein
VKGDDLPQKENAMQTETFGATDLLVLQNPLGVPQTDAVPCQPQTAGAPLWKESLKESGESQQIFRLIFLVVTLASALPVAWGIKAALALVSSDALSAVVESALR